VVVIAVKPQVVDRILASVSAGLAEDAVVISIAAGVPIDAIEERLPMGARVVRSMPNTAAIALAGATGDRPRLARDRDDVLVAKALFEAVGRCVVLDESLLDAVTGLSGSGPAYVMLMIEALADGGVKVGLGRDTALLLAAQTVYGAAKLQLETGEHPGRLKDMVTSPGGTAIAGLHTLEAGGLRRTLIDAVGSRRQALRGAGRADGEEAAALTTRAGPAAPRRRPRRRPPRTRRPRRARAARRAARPPAARIRTARPTATRSWRTAPRRTPSIRAPRAAWAPARRST
jgi:pyrroline-5-carboxylate reductase